MGEKVFNQGIFIALSLVVLICILCGSVLALPSECEKCHAKLTPNQVKDLNKGKMAQVVTCMNCHGDRHTGKEDVANVKLPTIKTCQSCHPQRAKQYLDGKHALGLIAMEAMPYTHMQPKAFIEGQKGCGGCHTLGLTAEEMRKTEARRYYKYGMDCQSCHTRHMFSKSEANEPEACMTCHMGFDHPQWEMWSSSKHGVIYLLDRKAQRAPKCQTCHMPGGNHRVMTAWGFLGVRLPEPDKEWMDWRTTILKGFGVLDPQSNPTKRLDVIKAGKVARLDAKEWRMERDRVKAVCQNCHGKTFVEESFKNADAMLKEADKVFAEAIGIVADLYKDGIIPKRKDYYAYPDLLTFYDVSTPIEEILYEMFMDHRMKTFQGAFHINPDYTTWYGYAKMKKDLVKIKHEAEKMRKQKKGGN